MKKTEVFQSGEDRPLHIVGEELHKLVRKCDGQWELERSLNPAIPRRSAASPENVSCTKTSRSSSSSNAECSRRTRRLASRASRISSTVSLGRMSGAKTEVSLMWTLPRHTSRWTGSFTAGVRGITGPCEGPVQKDKRSALTRRGRTTRVSRTPIATDSPMSTSKRAISSRPKGSRRPARGRDDRFEQGEGLAWDLKELVEVGAGESEGKVANARRMSEKEVYGGAGGSRTEAANIYGERVGAAPSDPSDLRHLRKSGVRLFGMKIQKDMCPQRGVVVRDRSPTSRNLG
ncbi:hypothetical protein B0H11DRAFT_1922187 [Mycena galericulata]|nr:hypothetical protein B0H11DRAFT_1922187 [Mycena galericulata]